MKAANRKVCGLHHYARQRILHNAAGVLHDAPQVHSSLAACGGFFTTRAASIKTCVSKIPFIDSLALVMKNALSRIVKNACGVMKKPHAAAHEECAGAHSEERLRRNEEAACSVS